jgi:hypothetical protein
LRPRRWSLVLRPPAPLSRSLEQAAARVPPHWLVPVGGRRRAPWDHGTSHAPRRTGSHPPAEGTRHPGSGSRKKLACALAALVMPAREAHLRPALTRRHEQG